jgi:hypothetical protein
MWGDDVWPEGDPNEAGSEGECQACETFGPLDDVGLCGSCSPRLERDLIRQRDGTTVFWLSGCLRTSEESSS